MTSPQRKQRRITDFFKKPRRNNGITGGLMKPRRNNGITGGFIKRCATTQVDSPNRSTPSSKTRKENKNDSFTDHSPLSSKENKNHNNKNATSDSEDHSSYASKENNNNNNRKRQWLADSSKENNNSNSSSSRGLQKRQRQRDDSSNTILKYTHSTSKEQNKNSRSSSRLRRRDDSSTNDGTTSVIHDSAASSSSNNNSTVPRDNAASANVELTIPIPLIFKRVRIIPAPPARTLRMPKKAEPIAFRKHIEPLLQGIFQLLKDNDLIMNPHGHYTSQREFAETKPFPKQVALAHSKDDKIGMTFHGYDRQQAYNDPSAVCHTLYNCDGNTPPHVEKQLRDIHTKLLQDIIADEEVPAPLRHRMHMILEEKGGLLGIRPNQIVQLCELCMQQGFGKPSQMFGEFAMFSQAVWDNRDRSVERAVQVAKEIVDAVNLRCTNKEEKTVETSSHPTAYDARGNLSTTGCYTDAIVGANNWKNAINVPAMPYARNAEEGFSKKHNKEQKQEGKKTILEDIRVTLAQGRAHFLDSNEELCPNMGMHEVLVEQFGCLYVLDVFGGLISVYVHVQCRAIFFLHNPLGKTGDSQWFSKMDHIIICNMAAEVLIRMAAYIRGEPEPDQCRRNGNAPLSGHAFEATRTCDHQSKMAAAATGRAMITDDTVDAIGRCNLGKAKDDPDRPVTKQGKRAVDGSGKDAKALRPVERFIVLKGCHKISFATSPNDLAPIVSAMIDQLFRADGTADRVTHCWKSLLARCRDGGELKQLLKTLHDDTLQNKGNRTERLGTNTDRVLDDGAEFMDLAVRSVTSSATECFWIREKQATSEQQREEVPSSNDLPGLHAGEQVVRGLCLGGMQQKLRPENLKHNTNATIGARLPANAGITVKIAPGSGRYKGFVRCYLHDHGEDTARGRKSNLHNASEQTKRMIEQQVATAMETEVGNFFWVRELRVDEAELTINVLQSDQLPVGCSNEPIYGHVCRENLKCHFRSHPQIVSKGLRNFQPTKKVPTPSRLHGFIRVCFKAK